MRNRKSVFLSYRRDDNPGYVRRLQEDLQGFFGEESVFLDIEDIIGGQQWKQVLLDNLTKSAALVVVIGPRWEQIWQERVDKNNDYLVYELNKAQELGVPVIPVTINGTVISDIVDLGPIGWLRDKQLYDISDRQGRWSSDVLGLVNILQREKGLVKKKQKQDKSKKLLLIPAIIGALVVISVLTEEESILPGAPTPTPANPAPDDSTAAPQASVKPPQPNLQAALPPTSPDISGMWQSNEGYFYEIGEVVDGSFVFGNDEVIGFGQFIPNMPRKIKVQIPGFGQGEYSISADNVTMVGWFYYPSTNLTVNYTLRRINY